MRKIVLIAAMLFSVLNIYAQKDKVEFHLNLRDGNVFTGETQVNSLDLMTPYGKLSIPIKNIASISIGISGDNSLKEKIKKLCSQMNDANADNRKAAYNELYGMPVNAIPVLEDFMASQDYVPSTSTDFTPESALGDLKSKFGLTDNYEREDIIVLDNGYRIGGTSSLKDLTVKTEYGTLQIPREKILNADVYYSSGSSTDMSLTLMANKHVFGNTNGGWLKTNIMVKVGQKFSISASGEIVLASLSNYKYHPDGSYTTGTGTDPDYNNSELDYESAATTYPSYGNVVFKIGENGSMTKVGAAYKGTATASGLLYFSIYETVFNANNTGSYQVKIRLN
ncbi:MAG: hypothetical protein WCM76_08330 [Bacteroidota bacterium]